MNDEQLEQYENWLNAMESWITVQKGFLKNFKMMKGMMWFK